MKRQQKYIVVKGKKVIREASGEQCPYAANAINALKPNKEKGERLYVEVAVWHHDV